MARLGWLGFGAGVLAAGGALFFKKRRGGVLTFEKDGIMIPRSQKALLDRMHRDNQLAIELGELAGERAERESVRDFGGYLAGQHRKSDYELLMMARRQEIPLGKPVPSGATELAQVAAQNANLAKLKLLKGLSFDHAFLALIVGEKDRAISQLKLAAEYFSDGEVGTFCKELLPSLYTHRSKAYELAGKSAPEHEFLSTGDQPPVVEPS